jgi:hypothetical protein
MVSEKLIETRGEEPAFIPSHMGESWQRVDFGLGAANMQPPPGVQEHLPPQDRHWGRMLAYALAGAAFSMAVLFVLRTFLGSQR